MCGSRSPVQRSFHPTLVLSLLIITHSTPQICAQAGVPHLPLGTGPEGRGLHGASPWDLIRHLLYVKYQGLIGNMCPKD